MLTLFGGLARSSLLSGGDHSLPVAWEGVDWPLLYSVRRKLGGHCRCSLLYLGLPMCCDWRLWSRSSVLQDCFLECLATGVPLLSGGTMFLRTTTLHTGSTLCLYIKPLLSSSSHLGKKGEHAPGRARSTAARSVSLSSCLLSLPHPLSACLFLLGTWKNKAGHTLLRFHSHGRKGHMHGTGQANSFSSVMLSTQSSGLSPGCQGWNFLSQNSPPGELCFTSCLRWAPPPFGESFDSCS